MFLQRFGIALHLQVELESCVLFLVSFFIASFLSFVSQFPMLILFVYYFLPLASDCGPKLVILLNV